MSAPSVILAEDEAVLRDELRQHLAELWPELSIAGMASTGIEALQLLERRVPDVMFLDIQMPGLTGLEVAQQVHGRCHIVFVTAYDAHAVAAFEAGAIDYVLKPIEPARLKLAIDRVKQRLQSVPPNIENLLRELAQGSAAKSYLRWINASVGRSVQLITVNEVAYFQADSKYTRVVTPTVEALVRKSLHELQQQLDPAVFWQIHRGVIVNVGAIHTVHRTFKGALEIKLKQRAETLPVSSAHAHLFKQL
jgi:DNA-binding LytR/AlgR family response regulator